MRRKSHPQKNTLLKTAQINAATKVFKRVFFFLHPKKNFILSFPPFGVFIFFAYAQFTSGQTLFLMQNVWDNVGANLTLHHLVQDRRAYGNSGFKKLAVQWLNEVQVFNQSFVQVDSFVLRNRQLLVATNR